MRWLGKDRHAAPLREDGDFRHGVDRPVARSALPARRAFGTARVDNPGWPIRNTRGGEEWTLSLPSDVVGTTTVMSRHALQPVGRETRMSVRSECQKKTGRYLAGGGIPERVFWTMAMPKSWSPANSGGRLPRMGPSVTVPGVPFAVTWKAKGASLTGRAVAFRDAGLEAHGFAGNATRRSAAVRGKVPKGHWRP